MFEKLLIANRGEIACRIIRTARAMGVRTVAVYSGADRAALHVRRADEAVPVGPSPASESYLRGDTIIAAALQTGAEAIHPGYGFLSENADFAQAVLDAGLVWVGPSPASIRAMGLKDSAKALMQAAGVPVTPGYLGEEQSAARLAQEAEAIGWPVLVKAVAGGGGKGMRRVEAAEEFDAALESCRREARAAFGNDRVLLEKWITAPRHIEVQVFGDTHGNLVHLFERDCSLQRRHQKVIEEAPAPGMDEATREAICAAAVRAAQAVDYVGAGTVEFIADASEGLRADRVFFMEMNTRLQVEHPVTEAITGVDLVEWQLRVASGEALPKHQHELHIDGHAIEARLYAEDPAKGFLPSTGRLEEVHLTGPLDRQSVRVETGVEPGDRISPFYDPMIAKLVVRRETRGAAIDALRKVTSGVTVWPVKTNAAFLTRLLDEPDFLAGVPTTGLIGAQGDRLVPPEAPSAALLETAADYATFVAQGHGIEEEFHHFAAAGFNWSGFAGFRLNREPSRTVWLSNGAETYEVERPRSASPGVSTWYGESGLVATENGQTFVFGRPNFDTTAIADGAILAPMPGKVIAVDVAQGDIVEAGQRLLVLEAMKMEHALTAPFPGTVAELCASEGMQVQVEALLARVEAAEA